VIVVAGIMFWVHARVRRQLVGMGLGEFMATLLPFFWSSLAAAAVCVLGQRFISWPNALVELIVLLVAAVLVYAGLLWWRARPRVLRVVRLARS